MIHNAESGRDDEVFGIGFGQAEVRDVEDLGAVTRVHTLHGEIDTELR